MHDARMRPRLILFAFVFLRRHNAVLNPVGMKHRCGEIEEKQAKAPAGGSERSEENKNADWDGANHPEKTRQDVSFIDVSQAGNDAEHYRDRVARFSFSRLCRAAHPITAVAAFGVFRQKMPAIRARHLIARGRFRRSCRGIRIFHIHTNRRSQAARNSSSTETPRDYSVRANRRQRTARPVGSGAYLRARRHPRSPSLSSFVLSKNNRGILFAHGTDSLSRQRASLPARNQQTGSLLSYQAPNLIYICCGENLLCYSQQVRLVLLFLLSTQAFA